ncbi:calmodulin-binding protein 60 B-like isoform X1 [Primulina huaijiensis]|uniref:calmodulin-binding protein 60 B-like isoform X1 n=1 Tax=Primulina huaijiensis TaxID=1492673 RepID=UPI003CC78C58
MVPKRKLVDRGDEEPQHPLGGYQGRQLGSSRLASSIFRGANSTRDLQDIVTRLEPRIRKWVQEAVDQAIHPYLSSSGNESHCSESRTCQLQFLSSLPNTLFTNSRVETDGGGGPIKIMLYDSCSKSVVKSGPLSAVKVNIVVLDGDFGPDDREDWEKKDFDRKVLQSREGKRPLVTGDLVVPLKDGVGYVGEISFTDNSRWIRSGKFRLGATVQAGSGEIRVREGMTNAFKVKDHRGESYQKHYPPSLDDEVWRVEKIAKDGVSHNRLAQHGLLSVKDFLRLYVTDMPSLRSVLSNISNKTWETIIRHAVTCRLDDKLYLFRTVCGTGLLFDSIYRVVGVNADGQTFHSLDSNDAQQMRLVEVLKQHAYKNSKDWIQVDDPSVVGYPMLLTTSGAGDLNNLTLDFQGRNFQAELEQLVMPLNPDHPTVSAPFNCEIEQDYSSFENPSVESLLQMQVNPTSDFIGGFYTLASEPQLSTDDLPIDNNYQVGLSAWHENGLLVGSNNQQIISSNSRILVTRNGNPKTSWCKILTVVKWRILVKRNAAEKKWKQYLYNSTWM